jgi:NADH:ubiquinone oxidoreductase subunit 4 (subunit M)
MQNIAFPGTGNFAGECLMQLGCVPVLRVALFLLSLASSFSLLYTIALVGGLFNGVSKKGTRSAGTGSGSGLTYKEFIVLFALLSANLYLGLNPNTFTDLIA